MMMKRLLPFALFAFAAPLAAETIDLLQAYQMARKTDQGYHAAEAARDAVAARIPQARAALLPQLSLTAQGSRLFTDAENQQTFEITQTNALDGTLLFTGSNPILTENPSIRDIRSASLEVFQPIFRWNLWLNLGNAELELARAEAERAFAEQQLMYNVATWYFNLLGARDALDLAKNEKAAIASQLEQSKARFEVGLTPITDTQEAQARYDLTEAQEIIAQQSFEDTQDILFGLVEFKFSDLANITNHIALNPPQPANMDEWMAGAQENNLSLKIADLQHQLAKRRVRIARSGHLPTLDLVGSYGYSNVTDNTVTPVGQEQFQAADGTIVNEIARITASDNTSTSKSIGLQLNLPLFSGGAVSAQTREAKSVAEQAKQLLGAELESTNRQVRSAYRGVLTAIQRVRALEQAVRSNQSSFDAVEAGYEVGDRTSVDVLNARNGVYSAKRDYTQARYDYLLELLRLRFIAGILNEQDLLNINQWLQKPNHTRSASQTTLSTVESVDTTTAAKDPTHANTPAADTVVVPTLVVIETANSADTTIVIDTKPAPAAAQKRWLSMSTTLATDTVTPSTTPRRSPRRR